MRFQAGIQIVLVVISLVIVYMVIKPKFAEIAYNQDEMASYNEALDKANLYNQTLRELVNRSANIPRADAEALDRFLPTQINATVVARDIKNIIDKNSLVTIDIVAEDVVAVDTADNSEGVSDDGAIVMQDRMLREARSNLSTQQFTVTAIGTYEQMKGMLADFERNAYPLRLVEFSFDTKSDVSLLTFSLKLETYALNIVTN
jgi:hypothetical protein